MQMHQKQSTARSRVTLSEWQLEGAGERERDPGRIRVSREVCGRLETAGGGAFDWPIGPHKRGAETCDDASWGSALSHIRGATTTGCNSHGSASISSRTSSISITRLSGCLQPALAWKQDHEDDVDDDLTVSAGVSTVNAIIVSLANDYASCGDHNGLVLFFNNGKFDTWARNG